MPPFDLSYVRSQFPALSLIDADRPAVYFDGPGGTQTPQRVIDAMTHCLVHTNANHGGPFRTSRESDAMLQSAHEAMADLLNAPSAGEIVFGANMTTLTFAMSRSIGRELAPGDEVLITRLDHDANRAPWQALAEKGVVVREVDFDPADCTLRLDDLARQLGPRTRLVAVGYASNAVGTINPIREIADMVHSAGAWLWVDAVHFVPHGPVDVQQRLVHQGREVRKRGLRDRLGHFVREAPLKHAEPHERRLFGGGQALPGLVKQGAQAGVPFGRVSLQGFEVEQSGGDGLARHQAQPCSGDFDAQRHALD